MCFFLSDIKGTWHRVFKTVFYSVHSLLCTDIAIVSKMHPCDAAFLLFQICDFDLHPFLICLPGPITSFPYSILLFAMPRQKVRTSTESRRSAHPNNPQDSAGGHTPHTQPCTAAGSCLQGPEEKGCSRVVLRHGIWLWFMFHTRWEMLQDYASDLVLSSVMAHFYFLTFRVGLISPNWSSYNWTGVLAVLVYPRKKWALPGFIW